MLLALLFALLALAAAQFDVDYIVTSDCTANPTTPDLTSAVAYTATTANPVCQPNCIALPGLTGYFAAVVCNTNPNFNAPSDNSGRYVITTSVYVDTSCGGGGSPIVAFQGLMSGTCIPVPFGNTYVSAAADCTNGLRVWDGLNCDNSIAFGGGGNASLADTVDISTSCFQYPAELLSGSSTGSGSSTCHAGSCFHKETQVLYQKQVLAMKDLEDHHSCAIPHVIKTDGVKITTTCNKALRVTRDHLVYTQEGLKTAGSVKVGDFLYNDMNEKQVCEVTTIEVEHHQEYFGLNCEESVVLANGYKTSTFGVTHDLPAIWMRYASKIFGINAASNFGDMVASFIKSWGLL
jgi:hypothetical protein